MLQVPGIRGGDRPPAHPPPHDRPAGVDDRDRQGQQGDDQGEDDGALRHREDRERRQGEAQEVAAAVSHEDPRRVPVEEKKADAGADQGAGQDDDVGLVSIDGGQ